MVTYAAAAGQARDVRGHVGDPGRVEAAAS